MASTLLRRSADSFGVRSRSRDRSDETPSRGLLGAVSVVAAVVPVLVAGIRGALRGWMPTGDDAYSAVRAWDVGTSNTPLLGTWSSATLYTGHNINHPGPLQFDLLALPVRLLGHGAGTAVGIAVINAVAVALLGWLVWRRLGTAAAALAMGASALFCLSLGSEILFDPWSQHAPLVPVTLFFVAAWCAVAGDRVALPVMVVAGSYALQIHLSYALLVPVIAALAIGAVGFQLWRAGDRRQALRWGLITVGVTLVVWAQPLYDQLFSSGEGNMVGLLRSAGVESPTPGLGRSLRAFGGTVAVPPAWLPPSYVDPSFEVSGRGVPTWLAAGCLLLLVAALAFLGWRAWRRDARAVAAGTGVALAVMAVGLFTLLRMPYRFGMVPNYARFMWPVGMVVWLALGVAILDEVRARWSPRPRLLVLPGVGLAVLAGLLNLPTADHDSASPRWSVDAVRAIDDDVVSALQDKGPVLVHFENHMGVWASAPALFEVLQDAGIDYQTEDPYMVRQLGEPHRYTPGEAEVQLIVRGGDAEADDGEEMIARSPSLTSTEREELAELSDELIDVVSSDGLQLADGGGAILDQARRSGLRADVASSRQEAGGIVNGYALYELWTAMPDYDGRQVLDTSNLPEDTLDRWAELRQRRDERQIRAFLTPVP